MTPTAAKVAACTACAVLAATMVVAGRQDSQAARTSTPLASLEAPWPDAATIEARRAASEQLPLFASTEVLALTLTADLDAIRKDRNPESITRHPGTIAVSTGSGWSAPLSVMVSTRGRNRLKPTTCDFPPLRVRFDKAGVGGTVFAGQSSLKLVTHCRDTPEYAPYLLQEYFAYRVVALHTPWSFRARLARITYVDASSGRSAFTHSALFLEDVDDVARRNGGRAVDLVRVPYAQLDLKATTRMALLQYLIANTDYGFVMPHNIAIVQSPTGRLVPVPYDFDMSGLVNTHYAGVNPKLGLASVRERLYRGPCRPATELEPLLGELRQRQSEVMDLYGATSGLERAYLRHARQLLGQFYVTISRPDRIQKAFLDRCGKHVAM